MSVYFTTKHMNNDELPIGACIIPESDLTNTQFSLDFDNPPKKFRNKNKNADLPTLFYFRM